MSEFGDGVTSEPGESGPAKNTIAGGVGGTFGVLGGLGAFIAVALAIAADGTIDDYDYDSSGYLQLVAWGQLALVPVLLALILGALGAVIYRLERLIEKD